MKQIGGYGVVDFKLNQKWETRHISCVQSFPIFCGLIRNAVSVVISSVAPFYEWQFFGQRKVLNGKSLGVEYNNFTTEHFSRWKYDM